MGFRKSWDAADIANQLHSLSRECSSAYNDGFTAFECKKVPNYNAINNQYLSIPVLNDFSTFGM